MRFITRTMMAAVAALMLAPQIAGAGDVEAQLEEMQQRISELEGQLDATQAEVEAAREETADARVAVTKSSVEYRDVIDEDETAGSSLSSFLEATEFSGWVAASYNYNFNGSDNDKLKGKNSGQFNGSDLGVIMPYHPDANTFSVDQVWFEIDKAVNEDSRAGFHTDLVFGKTAEILDGGAYTGDIYSKLEDGTDVTFTNESNPSRIVNVEEDLGVSNSNDRGDIVKLYSAYLSYLAPIGNGIQIDVGKLPTLMGAEVAQAPYNFNITRGLVYSLQPINHVGLILSTEIMPGISISAGVVNDGLSDANVDLDNNKAFTGQIAYATDMFSVAGSILYGSPIDDSEGDDLGVFDVLVTADPLEDLSLWLDFTLQWNRDGGDGGAVEGETYGLAIAGRYAISERWGASLRGEWLRNEPDTDDIPVFIGDQDLDMFAITGGIDFALTNHLQLRTEVRYDWADSSGRIEVGPGETIAIEELYWKGNGGADSNQTVALIEAVYTF